VKGISGMLGWPEADEIAAMVGMKTL